MISAVYCTLRRSLCDQISRRNQNQIRKYLSLFIRDPNGVESWKNGGRKSHDTLPLRGIFQRPSSGHAMNVNFAKVNFRTCIEWAFFRTRNECSLWKVNFRTRNECSLWKVNFWTSNKWTFANKTSRLRERWTFTYVNRKIKKQLICLGCQ